MIKGLYEAHLPVRNLDISIPFYELLGLKLYKKDETTAFLWIVEEQSWLGLWEGEEYTTPYHPSLRHIAFQVDFHLLRTSVQWLQERNIQPVPFDDRNTFEPFVRPNQGNASVYFKDPDHNSIEFISFVKVPDELKHITKKDLSLSQSLFT
ncbi:VOC family protein [Bacillus sp. XF8]|uniref:VOC family protein n=1 Tax=Bacillus sp. XF8 TaxID=2819289 RepID=UPI001AA074EA|nr:VOC family protein [Bacillus sp. XF8]MBO1578516.1 VOC family protein [Bacillus sp. XF8]